MINKVLE